MVKRKAFVVLEAKSTPVSGHGEGGWTIEKEPHEN